MASGQNIRRSPRIGRQNGKENGKQNVERRNNAQSGSNDTVQAADSQALWHGFFFSNNPNTRKTEMADLKKLADKFCLMEEARAKTEKLRAETERLRAETEKLRANTAKAKAEAERAKADAVAERVSADARIEEFDHANHARLFEVMTREDKATYAFAKLMSVIKEPLAKRHKHCKNQEEQKPIEDSDSEADEADEVDKADEADEADEANEAQTEQQAKDAKEAKDRLSSGNGWVQLYECGLCLASVQLDRIEMKCNNLSHYAQVCESSDGSFSCNVCKKGGFKTMEGVAVHLNDPRNACRETCGHVICLVCGKTFSDSNACYTHLKESACVYSYCKSPARCGPCETGQCTKVAAPLMFKMKFLFNMQ